MIIILLCVFIIVIGVMLAIKLNDDGILGTMFFLLGGVLLFSALIIIPVSQMSYRAKIVEYSTLKLTIENYRKNGHGLEKAGVILKVSEMNNDIAQAKYFNDMFHGAVFGIYIYDKFAELKYIK